MAASIQDLPTQSVDHFLAWTQDSQRVIETIVDLAQVMRWSSILRGTLTQPTNRHIVDGVLRVISFGERTSDPQIMEILSKLEDAGCSHRNLQSLMEIPAKFARFGKTSPPLIVDYSKNGVEMKYVLKLTDYREFLAQRVYHMFLKHCPEMREMNMHVCRTTAIANPFGAAPRYYRDELPAAAVEDGGPLDDETANRCQREIQSIISPVQKENWNRLSIPVLLISEKVDGVSLRELVLDGRFDALEDKQKLALCAQLGMSAALDFVFGNHDRVIHDICSNLGNIMLSSDSEGSIHCWLIDNGDVSPDFGSNLRIQREALASERAVYGRVAESLEGLRGHGAPESEDGRFSAFADFMQTQDAKEALRTGIAQMSAFLVAQGENPQSELNAEFNRISDSRLQIPRVSVPQVKAVGSYVPPWRRQRMEAQVNNTNPSRDDTP